MKSAITLMFCFVSYICLAQVEPRETSYENYDLLVIALIGLAVLIALYFLWRRRRSNRRS